MRPTSLQKQVVDFDHSADVPKYVLSGRRGSVLALVAASMVGFLGLLMLVMDSGAAQHQKRMAQAAADAGARAGADEIFRSRPTSEIAPAVQRETTRNGFTDGTNATVTVTYPTTSVNAPGNNFVKVVVQRTASTLFAGFFGISTSTIRAQAVAGIGTANTACLTVLDPSGASALEVKSGNLTTVGCGIMVDSNNGSAVSTIATPLITSTGVAVVGGPSTKPGGIPGPYSSGVPLPPGGADPLASLTPPAVGACIGSYGAYANLSTTTTLSQGVYCGGIGADHAMVTLNPGLYIIAGGGLYLKHTTFTGAGVTIFFTNAPSGNGGAANFGIAGSSPASLIDIDVNSVVQLSAQTTGTYSGVLFYGDPLAGGATLYTTFMFSSSAASYQGALYFPNQVLQAKSHSDLTIDGQVVVRRLAIKTGNENITINGPSSGPNFYNLKQPTIVE